MEDIAAKVDELLYYAYHCSVHPQYVVMGIEVFAAFKYEVRSQYALYKYTTEDMLLHPVKPQYKGIGIVIVPDVDTLELGFWCKEDAEKFRKCVEKTRKNDKKPSIEDMFWEQRAELGKDV